MAFRFSLPRSALASVLLLSTALGGCALLPDRQEIAPARPMSAYATDRSFAGAAAAWPSDAWWQGYGDPQLSALIAEGVADATDIRIAAARLSQAVAAVGPARGALAPTLDASAKIDSERQSYDYLIAKEVAPKGWNDAGIASLNLSWEIDFWGKNRAALAAAEAGAEAAAAEAAAARLAVSTSIASIYAGFAAQYADRDAVAEALAVRSKTAELMADRQAKGLENEAALERARSAEASARAQLAEADEQIDLTRNQLAAMLGKGPDRGLSIARPSVKAVRPRGLPDSLRADLLGRRPDIVAAKARAEGASHKIDQSRAAFYPNVNLVAVIGKQALGIDLLGKGDSTFGSVGPAVSLPIFDGGRLVAGERSAEAEYAAAVASYDGTLTQALRDVADAVAGARRLDTRLTETRRAAASAEKAWRVVKDRYNGGLATYLEVLNAEDALIAARRATAALEARGFALDVALVRALGGGFSDKDTTR